jgi:hypothetical protein
MLNRMTAAMPRLMMISTSMGLVLVPVLTVSWKPDAGERRFG